MNPKVETVEELLARRKKLHLGMCKLAREALHLDLQAQHAAFQVPPLNTLAWTAWVFAHLFTHPTPPIRIDAI
jgi:hypothetical protein